MQPSVRVVFLAAIAIVTLQVGVGVAIYFLLPDWTTRGQFGDLFGSVNALFSGLAFAGLIYAILLQREDLALQRTELELTREELKRSASAQEQSEIALRAQAEAAERSASLSAINFLLDQYKNELASMRNIVIPEKDPRRLRLLELRQREAVLLRKLDELFQAVANDERSK